MKRLLTLFLISFFFISNAQLFDGVETLLSAKEDSEKLIKGYTQPLMKSFIYGLNSGWSTSAKTHSKLGFDLTLGMSSSIAPDAERSFSPNNLELVDFSGQELPTIFSDRSSVPLDITIPGTAVTGDLKTRVNFPGGIGSNIPFNGVPIPNLQLGIGTFRNTDILFRGVPKQKFEGTEIGLFGIGLKHDLTQYFGVIGKLPFNLSALVAQTSLNASYLFDPAVEANILDLKIKAQTFQLLGSLDFPFVSAFGALGISRGNADFDLLGDYELSYTETLPGGIELPFTTTLSDPLSLDYKTSSFLATIGARLNLAFFKVYGQYSFQEYNTFSIGTSFSFR